ncbi:Re/Si-specific NAD(P)(+) transhydrogenase subunit alpha [Candidatus Woesearchaeota archaeon]|nr:Re/Si-specific NAD(P)(+) transhydrogenase subunit alpha [Candidatus Woesearchaeota archaeon]
MIIAIPKEKDDTRVSATPKTIKQMIAAGYKVRVQAKAGEHCNISDNEFKEAGAEIAPNQKTALEGADLVLAVNSPSKDIIDRLNKCIWVSLFDPGDANTIKKCIKKKIDVFSLNLIPRITRAQSMDVLSSQSNIAGYKAVIMGAYLSPKIFPLMMTAAGTINPAKVVILGAGVAGLQAIATAKRLGALVEVSDVRPEVKEQIESLGGKFIEIPLTIEEKKKASDKNGYAGEISKDYLKRQAEEVAKRLEAADIVITTALVAGKKAPTLITSEMVNRMQTGSVIVDLAALQGGNCALTEPGKIVTKNGVKIVGHTNYPGSVAVHSTQMFASNIFNFVKLLIIDPKNKEKKINIDDEIIKATMITKDGKIMNSITKNLIDGSDGTEDMEKKRK